MSRYREHRRTRTKGFESGNDLEFTEPSYFDRIPARLAPPSNQLSPVVDAEVLWFNAEKGFGFLRLSDGADAFIHLSRLQAAGHGSLQVAAHLQVRTEAGPKGPQVMEVVSVGAGNETTAPRVAVRPEEPVSASDPQEQEGLGVVKRYDLSKGFGFVGLVGGGKDVFVHATTLARSGVASLEAGQDVFITYIRGHKGLEVQTIRLR
jgi:CspA family cold shock protein